MVAGRNNAAVADQYRRRVNNGAFGEGAQLGNRPFFTQRLYRRAVNGFQAERAIPAAAGRRTFCGSRGRAVRNARRARIRSKSPT